MSVASGKCFLVTGPRGVGKTTLVMRVVESLRASHPELNIQGFYTREIREGSARVGFEVVTLDGRRGTLATSIASRKSLSWPCVGKYRVDLPSFETIALPELEVKEGTDLFIIDEVGKMELFSSSFYPAVLRVFESNTPILATIPIPKYGRDIPEVSGLRNHPKATVCTLNAGNRDAIKETIYAQIVSLLREQRMGE
ncbi:cancer-related nucleoside-triphosphatase homolog isoform X1 [Phalaenopsis equestris]|uniref:cancer-related nucleoside-triphosphatase homolog isoform X1 n=1 Tax=Phalaenopsis equestris TaxID=78828 RepID=UPI0009E203BF|nr:cancer-related nucleoside-triphosphatase homolog isoform X1 [Phalaenopsis equestris]